MCAMCYRVVRPLPRTLDYRNATVTLEIVERQNASAPVNEWVLQARKIGDRGAACVLASALLRRHRLESLLTDGFYVPPNTPADHVMRALERLGYVEQSYRRR